MADVLVGRLHESGELRILIGSRSRPSWVTPRRRVYGEVTEITRSDLTFNLDESQRLLGDAAGCALDRVGGGWPAVLGLIASATAARISPKAVVALIDEFIATECFDEASPVVKDQLFEIALTSAVRVQARRAPGR